MKPNNSILLSIVLISLMMTLSINSLYPNFAGGSGTEQDPWQISNANHLDNVRNYLGSNHSDKHFILIDDIFLGEAPWNTGLGWAPIGSSLSSSFRGTFDGNGHTISHLRIATNLDLGGLFGVTNGATIKNVVLDSFLIGAIEITGGLVAYNYNSTITDCYIANFSIFSQNGYAGGLVGKNTNSSLIDRSYVGSSSGNYHGVYSLNATVGGLVGLHTEDSDITNCYSHSEVCSDWIKGGLVGSITNSSRIFDCYSTGRVGHFGIQGGGLIGHRQNHPAILVYRSYWNTETSEQLTSQGGKAVNTQEMTYPYDHSHGQIYCCWDFDDTWIHDFTLEINQGYPYLFVVEIPPIPANLSSPHNGSVGVDIYTSLNWQEGTGGVSSPSGYRIYFGTDYPPSNIENGNNLGNVTSYQPQPRLFHNTEYFWKIVPYNNEGEAQDCPIWSFTTRSTNFAGGTGSMRNPWLIETAEQLDYVRHFFGDTFSDKNFLQIADISLDEPPWNEGAGWIPIGHTAHGSFRGKYDGGGYKITGLFIDGLSFASLFGAVNGAVIKNVGLINVDISGNSNVGGLVGLSLNTTVSNCYSTGSVTGNLYVGGLVGYNLSHSIIENSFSTCDVTGYPNGNMLGGLVGWNFSSSGSPNYTIIRNCFSTGDVSGNNRVGGLVGNNDGNFSIIENCYSVGNVTGNQYIGGLVGNNWYSTIKHSYSTGSVLGTSNIGGLVGQSTGTNVSHSVWDTESSGQSSSAGGNGVQGKTTLQMLMDNTYEEWEDFENNWKIVNFNDYQHMRKSYPILEWQDKPLMHNRIENAHVKIYHNRQWYWEGFPRLTAVDHDSTKALLAPLAFNNHIAQVDAKDDNGYTVSMHWDEDDQDWYGHPIEFTRKDGFKLRINNRNKHYLYVRGSRVAENSPFIIYHDRENWIGYYRFQPQHVLNALDAVIDNIKSVKAEGWSMHRSCEDNDDNRSTWTFAFEFYHTGGPVMEYGKMYKITTLDSVTTNISHSWPPAGDNPPEIPYKEGTRFFTFDDREEYESFFIEEIEDDENVLEVAVFAGDECVGASVFLGGYPLEILAYTDESHLNEEISFAIHREDQRGEAERIRVVEVRDNISGEYREAVVKPLRQEYTRVRLGKNEGEYEVIVKPEMILSQNYPNPIYSSTASRSYLTEIPFYVSQNREVTLTIYNVRGQRVITLFSGIAEEGKHIIGWNGLNEMNRQVSSGVYFYRLESGEQAVTRKMLIIR